MLANNKVLRGRYRIIQPLGQDAATAVYEAYDSERETNVALKEILIDLEKVSNISLREKIKHDFANQAKILAKVKHESLPQVRGYFAEVDRHYLIMELVDGADVGAMTANADSAAALSERMNWADQLLDTLDYLHTLKPAVVHRDINPANVKLTSRGKIKLLGFNIVNSADAEASMKAKSQSAAAAVLNYLSLEQLARVADQASKKKLADNHGDRLNKLLKQPIDSQSDVYALGATIYYLVTGQAPADALERTLEIWAEKPDPLPTAQQANSDVPTEISEVLTKAMEVERENRFETAAQMRQALQTAVKKAQERMAEETMNQEVAAARKAFLAEEKRLEQERQVVEQERHRIEAERRQQAELIERQLKEAEAQRIQAEQRAAEAEKRLSENQKTAEKTAEKQAEKPATANAKTADSPKQKNTQSRSTVKTPPLEISKSIFTEPPPDKKSSWVMPVAALLFLIVGGAAAGMWVMRSSSASESNKPVVNSSSATADKLAPETPVSTAPQTTVEKISEKTTIPATSSAPVVQNAPKAKTVQPTPTPKAVKPAAAPTKAPANKKKTVTVDDLIGN